MIEYPSIDHSNKIRNKPCIAFYKYDGSNLRWEWQKGKGFVNFGTRTQLFDKSHDVFGCAIDIFNNTLSDGLNHVFEKHKKIKKATTVTVFTEFFGLNSFAGKHDPKDIKELVLIDVHVKGLGMLGPDDFINSFGHLKTPPVIYSGDMTQDLIDDVKNNKYNLNEGIVCKSQTPYLLWMVKIKTNTWLEKLKSIYTEDWEKLA